MILNLENAQALTIRLAQARADLRRVNCAVNVLRGVNPALRSMVADDLDRREGELAAALERVRVLEAQRESATHN